jgi:hypothetical protein
MFEPESVVLTSVFDVGIVPVFPLAAMLVIAPDELTAANVTFIVPDEVFDAQRSSTHEPE